MLSGFESGFGQPVERLSPVVFAVIPVFNRINFTLACINYLKSQTYPNLVIIVVDGGSTDGTLEIIPRQHPDVVLLSGGGELWWAGAMEWGIRYALEASSDDGDMVLMINNDTILPPDYVATLVDVSLRENAAVGAVIVDSKDPAVIHDAGENLDWETLLYPVKQHIEPDEVFYDGVDVLPGRGSLVPLFMIQASGNIDTVAFPHYLADYDFFCRVKAKGFRLGVTYETRILALIEETGLMPLDRQMSFREFYRENFSRRSMANFFDHWRFIKRHAPEPYRKTARKVLIHRILMGFLFLTPVRILTNPFVKIHTAREENLGAIQELTPLLRWGVRLFVAPFLVTERDCRLLGLDPEALTDKGILTEREVPGWYSFAKMRIPNRNMPEVRRLYWRAWYPWRKPGRWRAWRKVFDTVRSEGAK